MSGTLFQSARTLGSYGAQISTTWSHRCRLKMIISWSHTSWNRTIFMSMGFVTFRIILIIRIWSFRYKILENYMLMAKSSSGLKSRTSKLWSTMRCHIILNGFTLYRFGPNKSIILNGIKEVLPRFSSILAWLGNLGDGVRRNTQMKVSKSVRSLTCILWHRSTRLVLSMATLRV